MSERIVRFSRLLRIFKLNGYPAYIIELEENNQKKLYISYREALFAFRHFNSYNNSTLKEEFKDLSDHCLMSQCTDATSMFENSHITHFEADCSSLVCAGSMFSSSSLCFINAEFPLLENGDFMFSKTKITEMRINFKNLKCGNGMFNRSAIEKITSQFSELEFSELMFCEANLKEIDINFPKLKNGSGMFYKSSLEKITSQFPMLKSGEWMFENTPLKEINCKFPNLKYKYGMFGNTPPELKRDNPQYFV